MSELIRKLKEKKFITKIKVKDDISDELLSKEIPQVGSVKIVAAVKEEIGPVRPPYAVMRETNPELMDLCVARKWAANNDYMTYEEAAAITANMIAPNFDPYAGGYSSCFTTLTHFEEFQWFKGIREIPQYCFSTCSKLTSITISDSVTKISNGLFGSCNSLTSIVIPNSIISIGENAFINCSSLTSITIPDSVTSIGYMAFSGCSSLTSITCLATTAPTVSSNPFGGERDSNYTGRNTYNQGINKLKVPTGATGYDTGEWLDPLCNAEKCGFTIEYI